MPSRIDRKNKTGVGHIINDLNLLYKKRDQELLMGDTDAGGGH